MSSSFDLKLKRKGDKVQDSPTILWMSTTSTRELTSDVAFIYADGTDSPWGSDNLTEEEFNSSQLTEYDESCKHNYVDDDGNNCNFYTIMRWHVLNSNLLEDVISHYKSLVDSYQNYSQHYKKKIEQYENIIAKSNSVEVVNSLLEEINEINNMLAENEEDINSYKYYYDKWCFVKEILETSNEFKKEPEYELIYWHD